MIPRFWSRTGSQAVTPEGKPVRFHGWRGSRGSPAEARAEHLPQPVAPYMECR